MTGSMLVIERLHVGLMRARLAALSGLSVERLGQAEDDVKPLTEEEAAAWRRGLSRAIEESEEGPMRSSR